jgi:hypothetical protein
MCRVPNGPPPAALYEAPTWLGAGDAGAGADAAAPALLPAGAAEVAQLLPADAEAAEAALLDSLLGPGIKAEPKAEPEAKTLVAGPPAAAALAPSPSSFPPRRAPAVPAPANFLAGMFAGMPGVLAAYPASCAGGLTHAAAAEFAAVAARPKRVSCLPFLSDVGLT